MPLSHAKIALVYEVLGQQLTAGVTLSRALRSPSPVPAAERTRLADGLEAGASVAEAVASAGAWLPAEDRPFLRAAAEAGRLPHVLAHLARRHERLAATLRKARWAAAYPAAVFHFGALIFPLVRMIDFERGLQGGVDTYLEGLALVLLPAWAVGLWLWAGVRSGSPAVARVLDWLPFVRGYRRERALADLSFGLGTLLEAGVGIVQAWREAAAVTVSPRLRRAALTLAAQAEAGLSPGAGLEATGVFPDAFTARYQTGETTGGLERSVLALAADHETAAERKLALAGVFYPGLMFASVAGMVGYMALGMVLRYVATLNQIMEGM